MKPTLETLQKDIDEIKERNRRVEKDKAWEISLTRKVIIAILTYIVVVIFFLAADLPHPFVNSLVPALAFLLSTLTLPLFKKMWIKKH
jgi:hypothetical protein